MAEYERQLPKGLQRLIHDLHDIRIKLNDACAVADILVIEEMNRRRKEDRDAIPKRT